MKITKLSKKELIEMEYWYMKEREKIVILIKKWHEIAEKALKKNLEVPFEYAMGKIYEKEEKLRKFDIEFGGAA